MKKLFLLSILCLLITQINAQISIYGKVIHAKDASIRIQRYANIISYDEEIWDSTRLNTQGQFIFHLKSNKSQKARIVYGNEYTPIYVTPGDSIYVEFDAEKMDNSIHYYGSNETINNYLAQDIRLFSPIHPQIIVQSSADRYKEMIDSITNARIDLCTKMLKSNSAFQQMQLQGLAYEHAYSLMSYPKILAYYTRKNKNELAPLPEHFFDADKDLKLDNPAALDEMYYTLFLLGKIYDDISLKSSLDSSKSLNEIYWQSVSSFSSPISDYLKTRRVYEIFSFENKLEEALKYYDILKEESPNNSYQNFLNKIVEDALRLQPGRIAPEIIARDINNKKVTLSQFKGKVVYIDFWATWCGPCKREIPYLDKVIEDLKNEKQIVFLSVSLDDDISAWKKMLNTQHLKGVQCITDGNFESEAAKAYQVKGIPHYVLVDKNGKIIANNAARPSQGIKELLLKAIGK